MQQVSNKAHSHTNQKSISNTNRYRQAVFNNRYSITDKAQQYDALNDPYASYYFANRSVKHHLRSIKKAIKIDQPNVTQQNRIKKLITLRLKQRYEGLLNPKKSLYKKVLSNDPFDFSKTSLKTLENRSRKSEDFGQLKAQQNSSKNGYLPSIKAGLQPLNNVSRQEFNSVKTQDKEEIQEFVSQEKKNLKKQKQLQSSKANKLAIELHTNRHKKWMSFLQDKKKMLQANPKSSSAEKEYKESIQNVES